VSFLFILSPDTKYSFPRVTMPITITATSAAVASPVAVYGSLYLSFLIIP